MTEIAPMPCGGRAPGVIAVEMPGYEPCGDCQAIRALAERPQCDRAPAFTAETTFEAWLLAQGLKPRTATLYASIAASLHERGITSPEQFDPDWKPGTVRTYAASLDYLRRYREALRSPRRVLLDEAWRSAVNGLPLGQRGKAADPLLPFITWLSRPENRVARDQAFKVARDVRILLLQFPVKDLLLGDPDDIAERVPSVAESTAVGDGFGRKAKRFRRAVRRLQEWHDGL